MQSSASVTGIQTWFEWKELNTELSSTTSVKTAHGYFAWFQSLGSIGRVFQLVSRRCDISIFRTLPIAPVMVNRIKFERRQSRFWKFQNRSHDICSGLQIVFVISQKKNLLCHPCIRLPQSNAYIQLKAKILPGCDCQVQLLWCFGGEKLQLLQ